MMSPPGWKSSVIEILRKTGDEDYQKRAWFKFGEDSSSPDELISQIFDELLIELFVESRDVELSEEAKLAGKEFVSAMNDFCDNTPNHLDPEKVMNDTRWKYIRELARRAASLMSL